MSISLYPKGDRFPTEIVASNPSNPTTSAGAIAPTPDVKFVGAVKV